MRLMRNPSAKIGFSIAKRTLGVKQLYVMMWRLCPSRLGRLISHWHFASFRRPESSKTRRILDVFKTIHLGIVHIQVFQPAPFIPLFASVPLVWITTAHIFSHSITLHDAWIWRSSSFRTSTRMTARHHHHAVDVWVGVKVIIDACPNLFLAVSVLGWATVTVAVAPFALYNIVVVVRLQSAPGPEGRRVILSASVVSLSLVFERENALSFSLVPLHHSMAIATLTTNQVVGTNPVVTSTAFPLIFGALLAARTFVVDRLSAIATQGSLTRTGFTNKASILAPSRSRTNEA